MKVMEAVRGTTSSGTLRADGAGRFSIRAIWTLKLACGHAEVRPVTGPTPPARAKCKRCEVR